MKKIDLNNHYLNTTLSFIPVLLVLIVIVGVYHEVIINPNDYLFIIGNDGVKNYYTFAYFINNGESSFHFNGMNYPYGESIFYLDSQPALSVLFFQFRSIFPDIISFSIPFINYLIIFSPAISAWFLYKIFRHIEVNNILSIVAAAGIALLAPQLHRFASHLALSYSFFIPIVIYLILKNNHTFRFNKYDVWLFLTVLFGYLLHAYIGAICAFITTLYYVLNIAVRFKVHHVKSSLSKLFIHSILPSVIFFLLISVTDHHTGRNTNPSGFFTYVSSLKAVFLQSDPFSLYSYEGQVSWDQWEGWAYVGMVTTLFLLPAFLYLLYNFFKPNKTDRQKIGTLLLLGIVSVFALLFSFSFPFNQGLEFLVDEIDLIKKFRSVGRFAWIFYYISGIITVWFLNKLARINHIVFIFIILLSSFYAIEAIPVYRSYSKFVNKTPNFFRFDMVENELKDIISEAKQNRYQAILPLPFYHIGSENYGKAATDRIYKESMILSYHLKVPLISSYLTHTSIWESKNIMQLLSPTFCRKYIMDEFVHDQDVLVYHTHEKLNQYEQGILSKSTLILSNEKGSIYSITTEDLFSPASSLDIDHYSIVKEKLHAVSEGILASDSLWFYYNGFDTLRKDTSFIGKGSYYGKNGNYNLLFKENSSRLITGIPYILSYWKYNDGPNYGQGVLNSLGIVTEDKKWLNSAAPKKSHVICDNWSLFELEFVLEFENSEIEVYEVDYSKANLGIRSVIDEILIYPKGLEIYKELHDNKGNLLGVVINNQPYMFDNVFFSPYTP